MFTEQTFLRENIKAFLRKIYWKTLVILIKFIYHKLKAKLLSFFNLKLTFSTKEITTK